MISMAGGRLSMVTITLRRFNHRYYQKRIVLVLVKGQISANHIILILDQAPIIQIILI